MVNVIDDNFMVCTDCLMAIANDDYTGLDYSYNQQEAFQRMTQIKYGIESTEGHICVGDYDKDEEFSRQDCECCGTHLAGTRHHCVVLK